MKKKELSLPFLVIRDEEENTNKVYISRAYIENALMTLNIILLEGGVDKAKAEIKRLRDELNRGV